MDSTISPSLVEAITAAVSQRQARRLSSGELRFRCPNPTGHKNGDAKPSADWNSQKEVWTCRVCGLGGGALDLATRLNIDVSRYRTSEGGRGTYTPSNATATVQRSDAGLTLAQYAKAKRLSADKLKSYGLSDIYYSGAPAVKIPYWLPDMTERAAQFRLRLDKTSTRDDRFRWKSGSKTCLYGLWLLDAAREAGYILLVEGASDCHTLWEYSIPAVGMPGAGNFNDQRDAPHFDGLERIYIMIERDAGGERVKDWLKKSSIRRRAWLIEPADWKDPSDLHLSGPEQFTSRWEAALTAATPWTDVAEQSAAYERAAAWEACQELAECQNILQRFGESLTTSGYAGSLRAPMLIYLILTSRRLPRPVSGVVKGPSAGGKSWSVESVTRYFPQEAYYALSAMSERALAYDTEPLVHRTMIFYEAAGLNSELASYLMRSLLSEGRVRYVTVEKTADGLQSRSIEREGPTNVILTTTSVQLHPENETRLLSIPIADDPEQTRLVLRSLGSAAVIGDGDGSDFAAWHALQRWLDASENQVVIPFASVLAELIPPLAVRLRRDFDKLLGLIKAHALLHQMSRQRNSLRRIVATLDDYEAVYDLVADLIADAVEAAVPAAIRQTVTAVSELTDGDEKKTCSLSQIAQVLKLDKSSASRRLKVARERGYIVNLEDVKGKHGRYRLGAALPEELDVLPKPASLRADYDRCSVASDFEGIEKPSSPGLGLSLRYDLTCDKCGNNQYRMVGGEWRCTSCLYRDAA